MRPTKLCLFYIIISCTPVLAQQSSTSYNAYSDSLLHPPGKRANDKPKQAIKLGFEILKQAIANENILEQAKTNYSLGLSFENLDSYDRALKYYLKALGNYEQLKLDSDVAKTLDAIGFIYWYLNNENHALSYYNRAQKIYERKNDQSGIATISNHRGLIFWRQGKYDEALKQYYLALNIYKAENREGPMPALMNNIGLVYQSMEDHEQALSYFSQALKVSQTNNNTWSIIENHNNIGVTYSQLRNYPKALNHLIEARRLAQQIESRYLLADNSLNFYNLYNKIDDIPKALKYFKHYHQLQDSLTSDSIHANIAALQTQYEIDKKEGEIELLQSQKALSEERLKAHKQWIQFLIAISATILISAIILYIQRKKTEQAYRHLVRKNIELVETEKEIKRYKSSQTNLKNSSSASVHNKYTGSALSEPQKVRIKEELERLMEEKKYYLTHDLTINLVAKELQISRTYLSQVINEKFGRSFINYINGLRIRDARHLLSEDQERLYTIESISEQVGFNSTNVFNKAFKRCTGITPSFYLKSLKNTDMQSC